LVELVAARVLLEVSSPLPNDAGEGVKTTLDRLLAAPIPSGCIECIEGLDEASGWGSYLSFRRHPCVARGH